MTDRIRAALYNEWDKPTASWLRELSAQGHIPEGTVDERSIGVIRPDDLRVYDQCHFFAGIGGWPVALRLAGYEHLRGVWTGSPPCQPFSVAGKGLGNADERHLAPVWLDLIRECRPRFIFGEQVEAAIRVGWLDDLFDALEGCGYACGAAVLPACSVGAPHIRKRLFFGAVRLADAHGRDTSTEGIQCGGQHGQFPQDSGACGLDYAASARYVGQIGRAESQARDEAWMCVLGQGCEGNSLDHGRRPNQDHGGWAGADWLGCRDSKLRPVEPGTQPLAHGLPARVGRLRGYGNAIVPQVAAAFVIEFMGAAYD